ncbi:MAG: ROK family protein [Acidobacteria bacterium]|nr:MAG: ROK family protein [Acidobacteriota bacterium]
MKQVLSNSNRNKLIIEATIRRFGPISRVQIHELTNVRKTTISVLVRELLEEKRLLEVGKSNNPLGRKQVLLRINEGHGYVAGVEFDDERVVAGVLDLSPHILYRICEPTNLQGGLDGLIQQLRSCVRKVLLQAKVPVESLIGIGVADPGFVNSRLGITLTSSIIDFWKNVPLKRIFEEEFCVPTLVESRTRAKTIAERMHGAGEKVDNLIYVDYGTGIGAGIVTDGRLLYGQDCGAGELGHTHIVRGGPACRCGSIGCLEAIASEGAIKSRMMKALSEGAHSQVLADGDPKGITVRAILSAANSGDKIACNIVAEVAQYLGLALANLVNLFNPSDIVLDKTLEVAGNGLLHQIHQVIRRQALTSSSEHLALRFGKIGEECGLLGVALLVLEKHFEISAFRPPDFLTGPYRISKGPGVPGYLGINGRTENGPVSDFGREAGS